MGGSGNETLKWPCETKNTFQKSMMWCKLGHGDRFSYLIISCTGLLPEHDDIFISNFESHCRENVIHSSFFLLLPPALPFLSNSRRKTQGIVFVYNVGEETEANCTDSDMVSYV